MKFKFITKIFILFFTFNNLSFGSPFDVEGAGDDDGIKLLEGGQNDEVNKQKSLLSPFDVEGADDDGIKLLEGGQNDEVNKQKSLLSPFDNNDDVQSAIEQKDDFNTSQSQNLEQESDEKDKQKHFQELSEVKLKIVNIHSGKRSDLQIKLGDQAIFDGININLEKCYRTLDDSYNKISIAYVSIASSDIKKHSITLSSDVSLSTVIASKYIVRADCM
jgi:hypothetical protein